MTLFHRRKGLLSFFGLLLFFLLLLLFPAASVSGAKNGIFLWLYQVMPSLLPFLILINLFRSTGFCDLCARLLSPILCPVLRCSPSGCYCVAVGILAGLPVGAKTVASFVSEGQMSKEEGEYLLPLCNHIGPLFCLGYICCFLLNEPRYGFLFYGIVILSPLLVGFLFPYKSKAPGSSPMSSPRNKLSFLLLDKAIEQAFSTLFLVGGYIILFSVLSSLCSLLPVNRLFLALLGSVLEISSGVSSLASLPVSTSTLLPILCGFVTFGGLSSLAQTKSVLAGTNIRLTHYLLVKALASILSFSLTKLFLIVF